MYLLDTNVISEIRKGRDCDTEVARWYAGVRDEDLHLSVIVVGEIRRGIDSLKQRDPGRAQALDAWLASLKQAFAGRILEISVEIAEAWGAMNARHVHPLFDGLLAATAIARDLVLVTRNVADIAGSGVRYVNPFRDSRVRLARVGASGAR